MLGGERGVKARFMGWPAVRRPGVRDRVATLCRWKVTTTITRLGFVWSLVLCQDRRVEPVPPKVQPEDVAEVLVPGGWLR